MAIVERWAQTNRIQFSATKTILGQLRGSFRRRPPIIKFQGTTIAMPPTFKYLGVTFGPRLNIAANLHALHARVTSVMSALTRMGHSTWGIRFPFLAVLYDHILSHCLVRLGSMGGPSDLET